MNNDHSQSNTTAPRLAARFVSFGRLLRRMADILSFQDVVLSLPFYRDGNWNMISGDSLTYRMLTFQSAEAANSEFAAFGNLATFGDAMFSFHLISAEEAETVESRSSYLDILERHKEAERLARRRKAEASRN